MTSLSDIFSLHGRADAQWRSYGLHAESENDVRRLTIDTSTWKSLLSEEALIDLRNRWNLESAEWKVTFHCEIKEFDDKPTNEKYETPLRVTQTRGDWVDLAPCKTSTLIPVGFHQYRVRIWAETDAGVLTFVDGFFENAGDLIALGPTSPGKIFWPGNGITLFVHWVGKDRPGFVTLTLRLDGRCPV